MSEEDAWTTAHLPAVINPELLVPRTLALDALQYWLDFFDPLESIAGADAPLSADGKKALALTLRAMSWVESKHGLGPDSSAVDPMQCGNPRDKWWRVLAAKKPGSDFFKLRPPPAAPQTRKRTDGLWASELVTYVDEDTFAPAEVKLKSLGSELKEGHDKAPRFNPRMSYFWAVPYLFQKINRGKPHLTYHFGDWRYVPFVLTLRHSVRMLDGARAYNGGGDRLYRKKVVDILGTIVPDEDEVLP